MKNGLQAIQLSCRQPHEHSVAAIKTRQHQRYNVIASDSVICVARDLRTLRICLSAAKQFDTVLEIWAVIVRPESCYTGLLVTE